MAAVSARAQHLADVLSGVRNADTVLRMLADPRNDHIVAEGSLLLYYNPETGQRGQFNGLLPVLALAFWPDDPRKTRAALRKRAKELARDRAIKTSTLVAPVFGQPPQKHKKPLRALTAGHRSAGLALGTLVHKQLEDAVYLDRASFERKYTAMAPSTKAVLGYIQKRGWTLVATEFCVADEALGVAARFDAVAVTKDGVPVFLEYKTGGKYSFCAEGPPMTGVLAGVLGDSDRNRALVQLAFSMLILIKYFPYVTTYEAYVLRPTEEEENKKGAVKAYPLAQSFLATYGPAMYRAVYLMRNNGRNSQ
jgi:hypothetical protein